MKKSEPKTLRITPWGASGQTGLRVLLLAAGCFLLGASAAALWFHSASERGTANLQSEAKGQASPGLSDSTKAILSHLNSPVELRFYSVLEPSDITDSLRSFVERVELMLKAYQEASAGKLTVRRYDSQAYFSAGAAIADGIKPFNPENGNPSFLGIALTQGAQKRTLPQLSPEWELALEADLSRAIAQVNEESADAAKSSAPPPVLSAAADEVKRIVPNFNSISLEEGTRILRENGLKQFKDAATGLQNQLQQAEQTLIQAQAAGSAAEQQAAMKHLQQLQSEQTERLKQIAANSQAQIEALRRLKPENP